MIEIKDLKKEYIEEETSTQALRGVTFSIQKGEFVSIMGPSGSGKSTLLHIMSFLDRPTDGSYKFQSKSIDEMTDQELAHVFHRGYSPSCAQRHEALLCRCFYYAKKGLPAFQRGSDVQENQLVRALRIVNSRV